MVLLSLLFEDFSLTIEMLGVLHTQYPQSLLEMLQIRHFDEEALKLIRVFQVGQFVLRFTVLGMRVYKSLKCLRCQKLKRLWVSHQHLLVDLKCLLELRDSLALGLNEVDQVANTLDVLSQHVWLVLLLLQQLKIFMSDVADLLLKAVYPSLKVGQCLTLDLI